MKGNIHYIRVGDYEIPDLKLPEETRSIGHWGRMHRDYLREYHPIRFNELILTGQLWTYLAGLNEQAQVRMETLIEQLKTAEGVTESLKANDPMAWVQRMNSIRRSSGRKSYMGRLRYERLRRFLVWKYRAVRV